MLSLTLACSLNVMPAWAQLTTGKATDPALATDGSSTSETPIITELVAQLGAKSFSLREVATQQLIEIGQPVLEQVVLLRTSTDRELRQRSQAIISEIERRSRADRLRRFIAGEELTGEMRLPGWSCMAAITSDPEDARRMWANVMQREWDLLKELEDARHNPETTLLQHLASLNMDRQWRKNSITMESVVALMIGAVDKSQSLPDQLAIQIYSLLNQVNASNSEASAWNRPAFRDVVGAFITRTQGPTSVYQGLTLAMRHDLGQQGLQIAERVLRSGGGLPHVRQYAILSIARFGGQSHIPALEELLEDTGVFFNGKVNGSNRRRIECQVRDLALASLIHLTGRDPRAVGFEHLQTNHAFAFLPHTVGFSNDAQRQMVIARYRGQPITAAPNVLVDDPTDIHQVPDSDDVAEPRDLEDLFDD
jgi:hypothetical protein